MDWIGDPGGAGFVAAIAILVLTLLAVAWGQALRQRQAMRDHSLEFEASEPDHEDTPRTTLERLRRRNRHPEPRD